MHTSKLLVASLIFLCTSAQVQADDLKDAIDAGNQTFVTAYNQGDSAGIGARYTEDAQLLPPGEAIVQGRSAIASYWQGLIDAGLKDLTLNATEVSSDGDMAVEVGQYTIKLPPQNGATAVDKGKYLIVYKKVGGDWLLHRDMWNSDPAAQ
jgi:uncharacterized protein (TIGR02246 family)